MAKDFFHSHVREALIKDGWTITHDPYFIEAGATKLPADLGAERMLAAEKDMEKIVVEVKSFLQPSLVSELHVAVGQYSNYLAGIAETEPDRVLFLAIPQSVPERMAPLGWLGKIFDTMRINLLIFDTETKTVVLWKKH